MNAVEEALEALAEVANKSNLLEILDESNKFSSSPEWSYYADKARKDIFIAAKETPENVRKIRLNFIEKLHALSDEEAKDFISAFKGTEFEGLISRNLSADEVLFKDRLPIFVKIFDNFNIVGTIDGVLSMLRNTPIPYSTQAEKREVETIKKKGIDILLELKKCVQQYNLSPKIAGLVMDTMRNDPEHLEELSALLLPIITKSQKIDEIESIALLWHKTASEQAERVLLKTFHSPDTHSLAKENAKRALIHIGKPMTSTENIILSGDFKGAIVPIKPNYFSEVSHIIHNSNTIDNELKNSLEKLISELQSELNKVPQDKADEAVAVAEVAKELIEASTKDKVNKPLVTIKAETLKQAAENIAKMLPTVLPIAIKIIELLVS